MGSLLRRETEIKWSSFNFDLHLNVAVTENFSSFLSFIYNNVIAIIIIIFIIDFCFKTISHKMCGMKKKMKSI